MIAAIKQQSNFVLQAPPGAGKSTYLPLVLLRENLIEKKILLLEPRRVAARNIAEFLAEQLNEKLGERVGLRMRGETKISNKTRIEIVTEGVLTRLLQSDPELNDYQLVLFDEFHERSLHADLAFALCYDCQQGLRDDLIIALMSATLDLDMVKRILPDAPLICSEGKLFPVVTHYRPQAKNLYLENHLANVILQALKNDSGHILVFLQGLAQIKRLHTILNTQLADNHDDAIQIYTLYGQLPIQQQKAALSPEPNKRAIILSTNIAETSLTIKGVKVVIDSGWQKRVDHDYKTGFDVLCSERISLASATQRAGRAGRIDSGVAYRIWPEAEHERLRSNYPAEIESSDLSELLLNVLAWGAQIDELNWPTKPNEVKLAKTQARLQQAGLLTDKNRLTSLGQQVADTGLGPCLGKLQLGTSLLSRLLLAYLSDTKPPRIKNEWQFDRQLEHCLNDKNFIQKQLRKFIGKDELAQFSQFYLHTNELASIAIAIWPERLAKKKGKRYILASGKAVAFSPHSVLLNEPDYIWVHSAHFSNERADGYIQTALELDSSDIDTHCSAYLETQIEPELSPKGELKFIQIERFFELELKRSLLNKAPTKEQKKHAWMNLISRDGFDLFEGRDKLQQLLAKLRLAQRHNADLFSEVPLEADLRADPEYWFSLWLESINGLTQLYKLNIQECVLANLPYQQQSWLKEHLPNAYTAPDGKTYRLDYTHPAGVKVAGKMQSFYGLQSHPCIANGKEALVVELLSPANRPIQTTCDLVGFWHGSYKEVQKDMKSAYPKHYWPDEPKLAEPGTQTKRNRLSK